MSWSLTLGCLWVLAGTVVAFLPMRYQYVPGVALLLAAPVLIWMIAQDHGGLMAGLAAFALISMFRNPLKYFAARLMGRKPEVPK
ncbi:DUF2484 family protein [Roseovarius aestuariivivens]|uniref:DUF2484 family protein n=1 Tax=Roseovarius aestuariivivens TaxID=1888910 RepID=UPI001080F974|nr:DUF2484 family protein [Roseovarius aestuariivivens]